MWCCGTASQNCEVRSKNGLSGIEFAAGIPASLGGAIIMNAGTSQGTIGDTVHSVTAISGFGERIVFQKEDLKFEYRSSVLKNKGYIVTEAVLVLSKRDKQDIDRIMRNCFEKKASPTFEIQKCGAYLRIRLEVSPES